MFKRKHRTDFLFSRTGFLTGAGSVFNLAGNYFGYNYSDSPFEADAKALASDWAVVGQDMQDAMTAFDESVKSEQMKQLTFDFNV